MPKDQPSYRLHKRSGQAVVTLRDARTGRRRDYYLGRHGSPRSRERYHALVGRWEASGRRLPDELPQQRGTSRGEGPSVARLALRYWRDQKARFRRPDGTRTSSLDNIKAALRMLRRLHGHEPAREFGPRKLAEVRQAMIDRGWVRTTINDRIGYIQRCFRWGAAHELVPAEVYHGLQAVERLRRGEHGAKEGRKVRPAPEAHVAAIEPYVSDQVWALIRLALLTGARMGELCLMRPCDLETGGKVWLYRPESHKNQHRGHERIIYLGPQAQDELAPFLEGRQTQAYIFDPREAGGIAGAAAYRDRYDVRAVRRAIVRACDQAFPPPGKLARQRVEAKGRKKTRLETDAEYRQRLTPKQRKQLQQWRRDHRWHPHQLRHNAATYLRREFGIEAAKLILGHTSGEITAAYAERDMEKAKDIIGKVG